MLRIAGWFSGVFFVCIGIYFEVLALGALALQPPNAAELVPFAIYPLVPLAYGISVIWRLITPARKPPPQLPEEDKIDAELAALIQRLTSQQPE